ncbi:MAG: hypothetical protein NW216_05120 [Hyphomicrobium sp.]|nr:hypothetical protein [Hyphomicrobium sp.]
MTSDPISSAAPEQLVLDLPHRQALEREDFLVTPANAAAVELIDGWPGWATRAVVVVGPQGSGKSHLTHVWRMRSGAPSCPGTALDETAIGQIESARALAVEDIDRGIADERVFFHLLNLTRQEGYSLLATARCPPGDLDVALPDLRSRLRALPVVHIAEPGEDVLKAVLVKLFADRQLVVEPHVIAHLALHIDRSFAAAEEIVATCDRLALTRQRRVTRPLAAEALASVVGPENEKGATKGV